MSFRFSLHIFWCIHQVRLQREVMLRACKDNVAQLLLLEVLVPGAASEARLPAVPSSSLIIVANTHLYSHPDFTDVKLWQSLILVREVCFFELDRVAQHLFLITRAYPWS